LYCSRITLARLVTCPLPPQDISRSPLREPLRDHWNTAVDLGMDK